MVADSVLLIEQLAANAWLAAIVQIADGWLLRHTPAAARRRSNSAPPPPAAAEATAARRAQVIDLAERFSARTARAVKAWTHPPGCSAMRHATTSTSCCDRGGRRS